MGDELPAVKVVLTGATGGVGRALAERLALAGAEMLVIGRRSEPLEELAARLDARTLVGDITERRFIDRFPDEWLTLHAEILAEVRADPNPKHARRPRAHQRPGRT